MANLSTPDDLARSLARRRRKRLLQRQLPFLVWIGIFVIAVALYVRQETGLTVRGFASDLRFNVASETSGRLRQITVELNQDVAAGQIVAALEDDALLLQLQEARIELGRATHELGRQMALWELDAAGQQVDQQTNLRRFARDASNAHSDYLAALAELTEDRITAQGLELTFNRTRQLEASELTPIANLDADRIAYEALSEKVATQESTVATMLAAYEAAEARYRDFRRNHLSETPEADLLLKPLESLIKVQENRIEMVNLALSKSVLRAPADGRVVAIFHRSGEVIAAGQTVLAILEPQANELVAYLPEQRIFELQPGAEVKVTRVADQRQEFITTVASIGSSVERLPARIDPLTVAPAWGLAVTIPLPEAIAALPGEAFEVAF